ncbi:glutamate receptor ionotropic, NMDA 2B isoform X2 [Eurytemora carolleeae]|uniref:glutamate receptor ionotropic, NMDA 2B isoform X2 n=1 Tax=Eurytemora carolleeae TaxID=1294199 RepID=UPI000C7582D8|nr:glutamate receptor ionotropic, NMDA 2B isoform X2 [Eurytemora carolleeae]|eukprot:XP_023326378.1 glutamate receptor ionotropic, NMDA 2B-like isoform X2 [Eurytemora affinis]
MIFSLFSLILLPVSGLDISSNDNFGRGKGRNTIGNINKPTLNLGLILPQSVFKEKQYRAAVIEAVDLVKNKRRPAFRFLNDYHLDDRQIHFSMMSVNPSPTVILENLCETFLENNVTAIIYMTNSEMFGRSTAASQYFLQLAGYLGIPVIAWNADNSGLQSQSRLRVQLAPSLEHQVEAMLALLIRYNWQQFSVVTSDIAGHDDFIQAVRDKVVYFRDKMNFKFFVQAEVKVNSQEDMNTLTNAETRIILLYSTKEEARHIMSWADQAGLTGTNYVWIVTQSVIGESEGGSAEALTQFPIGMLGVSFPTSFQALIDQIPVALSVYAEGVERLLSTPLNGTLMPHLSCTEGTKSTEASWDLGETFYKHIKSVRMAGSAGKPEVKFLADGSLSNVELMVMNLRKPTSGSSVQHIWEKIGVWKSWKSEAHGLEIKDIIWPGDSHVPPQGVPEKFHLTVGFLEEPPFINIAPPDPVSGKCNVDRGIRCRMENSTEAEKKNGTEQFQCCSGFCVDLLAKFAEDLQFEFDLVRVQDPKWGSIVNGKWNGLMLELVSKKFDMVLTSLKINAERESVVDFTAPFLESGTAILVAKRTGIISPTAFLEPFDAASWLLIAFAAVQISALTIFFFEWLSPAGYNMKTSSEPDHKFSICRTFWMVWALLFQAPVQMDCPRAFTARFMASVWALFAVVFLAIYTANLAAFMITREEWDQFQGIDDTRLTNPQSMKPPLRFGTVPWTYTENAIRRHFPNMHMYMKAFNKENVMEGVEAVKKGELDAFIYDGTVLEYIVGQDDECRLLTVGNWYAMTGYGVAFPRHSKHFPNFNKKVMDYSENGDLERLRRFWLTGTCRPRKQEKRSSEPLAPEQFLSAFFLLLLGVCLAAGLCSFEYLYCHYIRSKIARRDTPGCCSLISQSMGASLTMKGTVLEASAMLSRHKCPDPTCDTILWKVKRELDLTRLKLSELKAEVEARGLEKTSNPSTHQERIFEVTEDFLTETIVERCSTDLGCSTDSARISDDSSDKTSFIEQHASKRDIFRRYSQGFSEIETVL